MVDNVFCLFRCFLLSLPETGVCLVKLCWGDEISIVGIAVMGIPGSEINIKYQKYFLTGTCHLFPT